MKALGGAAIDMRRLEFDGVFYRVTSRGNAIELLIQIVFCLVIDSKIKDLLVYTGDLKIRLVPRLNPTYPSVSIFVILKDSTPILSPFFPSRGN